MRLSPISSAVVCLSIGLAVALLNWPLIASNIDFAGAAWLSRSGPWIVPAMMILALFCLLAQHRAQNRLNSLVRRLAEGDLEAREICHPYGGRTAAIAGSLNDYSDRIEAFMRESMDMIKAVNESRYYRRISLVGLHGDFRLRAQVMNDNIDIVARRFSDFDAMTERFEDEMGDVIKAMSGQAGILNDVAREVSDAMATSLDNTGSVAAASERLATSIHDIDGRIHLTVESSREITEQASETMDSVKKLSDAAGSITELLSEIDQIARQTNLLALNAAVESARAGETGRGFAVVAGEVKRLAEQTGRITLSINERMSDINLVSTTAVQAVQSIQGRIRTMSEYTDKVAESIRVQAEATDEIGKRAQDTAASTRNVVDVIGTREDAGSSSIVAMAEQLSRQSDQMTQGMDNFLDAARKLTREQHASATAGAA